MCSSGPLQSLYTNHIGIHGVFGYLGSTASEFKGLGFGTLKTEGPYYTRDPKRDHSLDELPQRALFNNSNLHVVERVRVQVSRSRAARRHAPSNPYHE